MTKEKQHTKAELIKNENIMRQIRKQQIEGMYICIQAFNVARILVAVLVIVLIIFA